MIHLGDDDVAYFRFMIAQVDLRMRIQGTGLEFELFPPIYHPKPLSITPPKRPSLQPLIVPSVHPLWF